jgi:hypothetical protein
VRFTVTCKIIGAIALIVLTGTLSMGAIRSGLRAVHRAMHTVTEVAEPISAAAYEMEINVVGTGLGVLKYLETGSSFHRERVVKDTADFARFKATYDGLAATPETKELGAKIDAAYKEFRTLGGYLMDASDEQRILSTLIAGRFKMISWHLSEQIQARIDLQAPSGRPGSWRPPSGSRAKSWRSEPRSGATCSSRNRKSGPASWTRTRSSWSRRAGSRSWR